MPFAWLLGLVLLVAPLAVWPAAPAAAMVPPVVQLSDESVAQDEVPRWFWVDAQGNTGLDGVLQRSAKLFAPADADTVYRLGTSERLWFRIRVTRSAQSLHDWRLSFPLPLLDSVTVYQQEVGGAWVARVAGDTIANRDWPEGGRYPFFRLEVPSGETRDVYVMVRHPSPVTVPIRISPEGVHDQRMQWEYLFLGMIFGAMGLLIIACTVQGFVYRERSYAGYGAYVVVTSLAVAAYTGVASHMLWSSSGFWADAAQGCLALLAGATALLFVRHLCGIQARFPLLDKALQGFGIGGVAAAFAFAWVPRGSVGLALVSVFLTGTVVLGLAAAAATWLRGDDVGRWVFLAYAPMGACVIITLLRVLGWMPTNWLSQYGVVAAMVSEVPLLLIALSVRLRDRQGAQARANASASQDALTGLLSAHLFNDRLRQVVGRARRFREPAAVVMIDLVNYPSIRRVHGASAAEQSVLRTVIKMRRVLRDVDTASRVGEARFALIMEGMDQRGAVTERAAQLIALGLMPLKGLRPDVTLQFHISAVLLSERLNDASELMEQLASLLADMSPRTRRPIRFLEPEVTKPMSLDTMADSLLPDSLMPGPDSLSSKSPESRPGIP